MAEQLGIAPLADNDPRDKYFYEIIVCTGMRRNAGTNSQVCFILSGEDDETDVRAFTDSKRKIFRRGQIDGFLMAVPRPLGYLNFMRVWHDNSGKGKFGSWYLNYVVVRDVQSDTKHVFVANRWLAVEEDDGQVDRVLPVAGKEQLADFSYQFGERSRKDLADGHLWFSVVARPPQSRFTCLQRVSCCLCLLYVTMLTNAMFYNTTGKEEGSNAFTFGPFSVSPEQITIGVISNLIVFPVNFLLIFLFRKSRPHHKRPSRIDRAIKEVHDSNKQTSINDVKPEVSRKTMFCCV
ncbi:polycystic kidney disease protein 1-like 2 [Plakobranchus ocellatus]|uniref:Polycystic kidney disease protein 1-like 2 n=1 Tax=Plakobranchus ocellatus TaxID=259542 RepID=A0AAV4B9R4_9GAST|nr:polycystic kidney disease protein 1-like 2 [Plakobranchus ocellatus]